MDRNGVQAPLQTLRGISMLDVLDDDPRPSFIVDLEESPHTDRIEPVYGNPALTFSGRLEAVMTGKSNPNPCLQPYENTFKRLIDWVYQPLPTVVSLPFVYHGWAWTCTTIKGRWRMVNGIKDSSSTATRPAAESLQEVHDNHDTINLDDVEYLHFSDHEDSSDIEDKYKMVNYETSSNESPVIVHPIEEAEVDKSPASPPVVADPDDPDFVINFDWSKTRFGPRETWSRELRQAFNFIHRCCTAAAIFWGPDMLHIYNKHYAEFIGSKHPSILGLPAKEAYIESWDDFEPFHLACIAQGKGMVMENMQVFLPRGPEGDMHETYWTFCYSPQYDDDGNIPCWFSMPMETTKKRLAERRLSTILDVGEATAAAQNLGSFWKQLMKGLQSNANDIPFALLYTVDPGKKEQDDDDDSDDSADDADASVESNLRWTLEGSVGLPPGSECRLEFNHLSAFGPYFKQAISSREPLLVECGKNGSEAFDRMMEGMHCRTFYDPLRAVVILKIVPTSHTSASDNSTVGILVIGVNTRGSYDEEYRQFIQVLDRQIATSVASVILLEEEVRRGRTIAEQARLNQDSIEQKLRATTSELQDRDLQLRHLTDCVPVGISVTEFPPDFPQGRIIYTNDKYTELTGVDVGNGAELWQAPMWQYMTPDDVQQTTEAFYSAKQTLTCTTRELSIPRMKDGSVEVQWLLAYTMPVIAPNGTLHSLIASLTDITAQKWAEDVQKRRTEELLEAKRQQENFIDATSHEMRNPLSAMMISADEIMTSLRAVVSKLPPDSPLFTQINSGIEAAQVIADCALHQKRIVDDILTVSKIDSGLFSIAPVPVQIVEMMRKMLRMYEGEFKAAEISQCLLISESINELNIDWVLLDTSRLLQVLINLITNAIKFTKYATTRNITVTVSASFTQPSTTSKGYEFLVRRREVDDSQHMNDTSVGKPVYLTFSVDDTGRGLTDEAKELLFQRFHQVPKTHVNYGGSGLGLFISRELVELQGGQIGVHSDGSHQGTDFSFYIKANTIEPPSGDAGTSIHEAASEAVGSRRRRHKDSISSIHQIVAHRSRAYRDPVIPESRPDSPQSCLPFPPRLVLEPLTPDSEGWPDLSPFSPMSSPLNETGPLTPYNALIVEDNLVNQRIVARQLKKLGYTISIANHGQECLDILLDSTFTIVLDSGNAAQAGKLRSRDNDTKKGELHNMEGAVASPPPTPAWAAFPFLRTNASPTSAPVQGTPAAAAPRHVIDVILLDSEMPIMDGLACIRQIRRYQAEGVFTRHVPVVGITANARDEQVREALEAGMDAVVCKPFRIGEVVSVCEKVVREVGGSGPTNTGVGEHGVLSGGA